MGEGALEKLQDGQYDVLSDITWKVPAGA